MSHVMQMSRSFQTNVAHMREARWKNASVLSHVWMIYVTRTNQSCNTREWALPNTWTSHFTCMNWSWHTNESVISHAWISHAHMNESKQCVYCSVLQCVAVCCSALQCIAVYCSVLQCIAVCCNKLQLMYEWVKQHTGKDCNTACIYIYIFWFVYTSQCCRQCQQSILHHPAPHCNTLHHPASHCNTLHHTTS